MLQILHQFLPGSLTSAVVNATLAIGTCCLVMVAQPGSFVSLFILSFASFSAYLPVIGLLADKERRKSDKTRHVKCRGIDLAKNQFILTFLHGIIWTVFIGVFMADLVKLPMSFTCPSKQCVTYTLAMTVAYFNLFVICAQLAALTEIVCQVQSCPARVLADRTLGHILRKSISQLISLRQEGKRVKAMGMETQSPERGEVRHMTETTRDLVLADINLAEPRDEDRNRRRRTRTTSGNGTITNKSRHHRSITLGDLAAVVQYDSQGGARNPFSGTRNPFSDSEKVHQQEDHSADLYGMIPTARRVAALKSGQPKTPPNFSRPTSPYSTYSYNSGLRAISPAQPESFIMPYTPMSILQSPESRYSTYSRWSADVTPTSRHSKVEMEGSPDSLVGETVKTPTG